jgi:hypothetical protein
VHFHSYNTLSHKEWTLLSDSRQIEENKSEKQQTLYSGAAIFFSHESSGKIAEFSFLNVLCRKTCKNCGRE